MDRGLRLVVQARPGVCALYPIPVRHPVLSRYPVVTGRLPPEAPSPVPRCHTATPFASIWLGLRLAKDIKFTYTWLTYKNMCRARHTQGKCTRTVLSAAPRSSSLCFKLPVIWGDRPDRSGRMAVHLVEISSKNCRGAKTPDNGEKTLLNQIISHEYKEL